MNARVMETEAGIYWRLARNHAALTVAFGPACPKTAPIREDLEAIALHSDWPRLRAAAAGVLQRAGARRAVG